MFKSDSKNGTDRSPETGADSFSGRLRAKRDRHAYVRGGLAGSPRLRGRRQFTPRSGRRSLNDQLQTLRDIDEQIGSTPLGALVPERPVTPSENMQRAENATQETGSPHPDGLEVLPADVLDRSRRRMPNRRPVHNPYQPKSINTAHRSEVSDAGKSGTVRSTGVVVTSRREAAQRRAKRRTIVMITLVAIILFGSFAAGIAWMDHSNRRAAEMDLVAASSQGEMGAGAAALTDSSESVDQLANVAPAPSGDGAADLVAEAERLGVTSSTPTPIFATFKDLSIYLPVSLQDLTEVAFHQANYSYTVQMETHLPTVNASQAKEDKGTGRDKSVQPSGGNQLLVGSCIEMWRSGRNTKQRTAADAGAKTGSIVFAPVTGTVTKVRTYMYEGKFEDYEVHIEPDGLSGYEVVVIHIDEVVVQEGDRVAGGATPIARIANIASVVRNQLATYAGAKGNHAHIQINNTRSVAYKARHGSSVE